MTHRNDRPYLAVRFRTERIKGAGTEKEVEEGKKKIAMVRDTIPNRCAFLDGLKCVSMDIIK